MNSNFKRNSKEKSNKKQHVKCDKFTGLASSVSHNLKKTPMRQVKDPFHQSDDRDVKIQRKTRPKAAPYASKTTKAGRGRSLFKMEAQNLRVYYDSRPSISKVATFPDFSVFYKVRYAPGRHMNMRRTGKRGRREVVDLVVNPDKLEKDFARYYMKPPPVISDFYIHSVRDFVTTGVREDRVIVSAPAHLIKSGRAPDLSKLAHTALLAPVDGASRLYEWQPKCFHILREAIIAKTKRHPINHDLLRCAACLPVARKTRIISSLNGNNGSWTNTDDVDRASLFRAPRQRRPLHDRNWIDQLVFIAGRFRVIPPTIAVEIILTPHPVPVVLGAVLVDEEAAIPLFPSNWTAGDEYDDWCPDDCAEDRKSVV